MGERGGLSAVAAAVITAAFDAAETAGLLPHGGLYGDLIMPDPADGGCCDGSAAKGPQYCTCWEPVYDVDQQPAVTGEPGSRDVMCSACAYKPGSPERQGDTRYRGDADLLDRLVLEGVPFFCHVGVRRVVQLAHPAGVVVDVPPGDYQPPVEDGIPYKADGSPGDLCAGWSARTRARVQTITAITDVGERTGGEHQKAGRSS